MNKSLIVFFFMITTKVVAQSDCSFKKECSCDDTKLEEYIKHVPFIIEGKVIKADTLLLTEIISNRALSRIKKDTTLSSQCAKKALNQIKIISVSIEVKRVYKGEINTKLFLINTPLETDYCGFDKFIEGHSYIIYGTIDDFADIYFLYGLNDYLKLKTKYQYWTNYCQPNSIVNLEERSKLKRILEQK